MMAVVIETSGDEVGRFGRELESWKEAEMRRSGLFLNWEERKLVELWWLFLSRKLFLLRHGLPLLVA